MLILKAILLTGLASFSQINDINHRESSDKRVFQNSDGKKVTLEVNEKICESFSQDGMYSSVPDKDSKSPRLTVTCQNKQRIELKTKDDSGEMLESWKDGKRSGPMKKFNEKGLLVYESNYIDGEKEGEEKTYFENGKISTLRRYKKGQLDGEQVDYDKFGRPTLKFMPKGLRSHKPKKKTQ